MDWKSWIQIITIVGAVVGGVLFVTDRIAEAERRMTAQFQAGQAELRADISNLQTEVRYIKGRLDPLKISGEEPPDRTE